jgi:hypothetical protein
MKPTKTSEPNGSNGFTREFSLTDGRQISIARFAITYLYASKENPESETVLGIRGAPAVSIAAPYAEVSTWWRDRPSKPRPLGQDRL